MDTLPLYILIITGSVTTSAEIAVQGIEGETLLINWTYPRGYESYAKYFVSGEYSTATLDKLVESHEGKADQKVTKGKYSLYDYKSAALLTVAITKLSLDDTGTYHFGIKEFGRDTHMNVRVSVIKAPTTVAPLSTLTTYTDTEGQLHTTSPIDGRPETALITLTTRDANNATSTDEGPETELTASTTRHANKAASSDEGPETELTASTTRHANKAASSDVLSTSMNMSQSSQTPNDMIPSEIRKAENPVIKIAVSTIALVLVLLLIIGMYYAKMKNKKAVSSTGVMGKSSFLIDE
ncbi:CMRF35-like molecule 9 [Protopterus annectens]|uniref:CMRF35-like molecule 9 n=1 Tax=Protopterus annectens TaxID=7888 RepID=UPI001CFB2CF9|nr:CMRF35-like molecule 9 [Protopterus annectens]